MNDMIFDSTSKSKQSVPSSLLEEMNIDMGNSKTGGIVNKKLIAAELIKIAKNLMAVQEVGEKGFEKTSQIINAEGEIEEGWDDEVEVIEEPDKSEGRTQIDEAVRYLKGEGASEVKMGGKTIFIKTEEMNTKGETTEYKYEPYGWMKRELVEIAENLKRLTRR